MAVFTSFERRLMHQLLRGAHRYKGKTFPNPVVGAAVYHHATCLSTGFHCQFGENHAEYNALKKAGASAKGASLMVSLSPCTHHGNTPPCVDAIINAGISEVIYAIDDPNPKVTQKNARHRLESAGIQVRTGLCQTEARDINAGFFSWMTTHKPFVHLKVGMSIDGGIALASDKSNGESKYITSESSLKQVHRLRREVQAIIVGIGTVLADQPQLNVRYKLLRHGYQLPQRIILDPNGKIPLNSVTLDADHGGHTIVCVSPDCPTVKKKQLTQVAEVWELPVTHYGLSWPTLLSKLGQLGMQDVLIEGGQKVFSSALSENCVDLCHFFMAPIILGSPTMVPPFNLDSIQSLSEGKSFARWHHQRCGNDLYVKGWF